jgi:putative flippase GtrA
VKGQFASKEFVLFLVTGGVAALVNFFSRIGYNQFFEYSAAIVCAYVTGMITAFVLARIFVFKSGQQAVGKSIGFFVLINFVAITQTWLVSQLLALYVLPSIGVKRYVLEIAHAVGVIVPVFSSYLGHKRFSFK